MSCELTTDEVAFIDQTIAELQAENAKLLEELSDFLKCESCEAMLDCDECLRADSSQKERGRLDYENTKLRELVRDMAAEMRGLGIDFKRVGWCDYADQMRELGVEVEQMDEYEVMPDERLRPCPFCGAEIAPRTGRVWCGELYDYSDQWHVVCDYNRGGCGAIGGVRCGEAEAIDAWNRRADS